MQEKINVNCLVVLKPEPNSNCLKLDYLEIAQLFNRELAEFQNDLETGKPIKITLRKFKDFYYLLEYYDYCKEIVASYQGIPDYSGYKGVRHLLSEPKEDLVKFVTTRVMAHRIERTYSIAESLIKEEEILAYSHRKVGWSAKPFQISDRFKIQFNTNFGYGYVSYFYLVVKYENIIIIPYSDWIIYHNASIYEIQRYTRKYPLKDESWIEGMEDCKSLYNLSVSDNNQFIERYIIQEAQKMVEGLKKIMLYSEFQLLNLNKDAITIKKEGYKIIEYRAEKVSGALKFIVHLKNFSSVKGISEIISEIKTINQELLPVIKQELELLTDRLNKIEPELTRLKPILERLNERYSLILTKHNEIDYELHEKYQENYGNKDRTKEIEKLLTKAFPNWKTEEKEYFETHNNSYNPLKMEMDKLKPVKESIEKYLNEIEQYLKNN